MTRTATSSPPSSICSRCHISMDRSLREWFASFWTEYLAKLQLDDQSLIPTEPAKSTNTYFPMPPNGAMAWISAYIAQSQGRSGVYLTFAKAYEKGVSTYEQLESDRDAIEHEVGAKLSWERSGSKIYVGVEGASFSDLNVPADRDKVTTYLADMTARMIRVFKPRLEAAVRISV